MEDTKPLNVDGLLATTFFKEAVKAGTKPGNEMRQGTKFLRFLHQLTDNLVIKWDTAVKDGRLYIQLPDVPLQPFSRDSLVELLDVVEDACSQAIIWFPKNHQNCAGLIRTFKFIGFEMLPPLHKWAPKAPDVIFMAYNIES